MTAIINIKTDTLWNVAFSSPPSGKLPLRTLSMNEAASEIIRNHHARAIVGRVLTAIGSVILVLGLVLAAHSLFHSPNTTAWALRNLKIGLVVFNIGLAIALPGGYQWYVGSTRLKDDKTKTIDEVYDYVLSDIIDLKNGGLGYGHITRTIKEDADFIKDAIDTQH